MASYNQNIGCPKINQTYVADLALLFLFFIFDSSVVIYKKLRVIL